MKTECILNVFRGHQTALIKHRGFYFAKHIAVIAIFVFLHSFSEDHAVQVFSVRSVLNEVCSERKQDFTLTVSLSFYWSHYIYIFNYFYFFYHTSFACADIDANTMCLSGSILTGAWKTLLSQEKNPSQRPVMVNWGLEILPNNSDDQSAKYLLICWYFEDVNKSLFLPILYVLFKSRNLIGYSSFQV